MSLALLLEKYDVSTDEGLQKALSEIEKEECEVDEALSNALARSSTLEGRLRSASQAFGRLGAAKADAEAAAAAVERTADLARDVSAKVRQLDLARSLVWSCQRRVQSQLQLQVCATGVQGAVRARDVAGGAAHVARYRALEPTALAMAPAVQRDMEEAAKQLREQLVRKFDEAARKEDEPAVESLFKLFPQLGCAEEGVHLLAKYIATQLEVTIRRVSTIPDANLEEAVFADALTRLLEAGGAGVERVRALAAAAHAPGLLHAALATVQPVICSGARRVWSGMRSGRKLDALSPRRAAGTGSTGSTGGTPAPDPRAAERALAELALAHSRIQLYFSFVTRKNEADAAPLEDSAARAACSANALKLIAECELTRVAHDILAHYLALERYFLEESVSKALKMAAPQPGATTSSLVDDVFFIAKKVIRRALSTGSADGACAVLNDVCAALERDAAGALRRQLRSAPPDPLPLPPPHLPHQPHLLPRLPRDTELEAQRALFLAHMNEAEAGAEWSEQLAACACAEADQLLRGAGGGAGGAAAGRDKLRACAAGLAGAAAAFRAAHDLALAALRSGLRARVNAWADRLADPDLNDDGVENEADALPAALETLYEASKATLSARAAEALLLLVVGDLAARAESRLLHHHYRREGALMVERRARRLAAWAGGACGGARERCLPLTHAATALSVENLAHLKDVCSSRAINADLLARRIDFKIEDIKRLKL